MNVVLILLPLTTFYAMCARELLPFAQSLQQKVKDKKVPAPISFLSALAIYALWLCVAFICAPFFILFVAAKQVYIVHATKLGFFSLSDLKWVHFFS